MSLTSARLRDDIYYDPDFARLYLKPDDSLFQFDFREEDNWFFNLAIKRPITMIGSEVCHDGFFDMETPYGYGGYLTNSQSTEFIQRALESYRRRCLDEGIIAEFIRFHPFQQFPAEFSDKLDLCVLDRQVVTVRLSDREQRWQGYSSTTRNILRKTEQQLTVRRTDDTRPFEALYNETMRRNQAADFYFFDQDYYKSLIHRDGVELLEVLNGREIIAAGFFFFGEDLAHYHLSANKAESLKLNANYALLEAAFERAREQGCKVMLLGGGRSPDREDSLLKFKQKFSKETRTFYIAGKVFNREVFERYNQKRETQLGRRERFFLYYRWEDKS